MEKVFADNRGIGLSDTRLIAAKRWLPEGMAFDVSLPLSEVPTPESVAEDEPSEGAEVITVPAFLRDAAA